MYKYSKPYLSVQDLIIKLNAQGMIISSHSEAEEAFNTIGYYRLRGYCYQLFDRNTKKYIPGTDLSDVIKLYHFDTELAHLIFEYLSKIEVSLRVRFVNAFQPTQDTLALNDPSFFSDKGLYWKNQSTVSTEIARSNDVFISHNFDKHDGAIPLWATVEILSFGTLSKLIKNLQTGTNCPFTNIVQNYKYTNIKGNTVTPSKDMFASWIYAASIMRNICAHNGRIYNRTINTAPKLISSDTISPQPRFNGLYQIMLAMKYLRPTDQSWNEFVYKFNILLEKHYGVYDLNKMNFPNDWIAHFQV